MRAENTIHDKAGLVLVIERRVQVEPIAIRAGGPEFLPQPCRVVGDERVGGIEDGAGGAVILLQPLQCSAGKIPLHALHVFHARAAETVDGLIVVADGEQRAMIPYQQAQPCVLQCVRVLELIHQHVPETLAVVAEHIWLITEQLMGAQQEFRKIHQPGARTGLLVGTVDLDRLAQRWIASIIQMLGTETVFLLAVDEPLRLARRKLRLVQLQGAHDAPHGAQLVVTVQDLK